MHYDPANGAAVMSVEPRNNDVLFGRGDVISRHPGNKMFRQLVGSHKRTYRASRFKQEKRMIAESIMATIHGLNPPGRFLAKNASSGHWQEVDSARALEKTLQTLREKDRPGKDQTDDSDILRQNSSTSAASEGSVSTQETTNLQEQPPAAQQMPLHQIIYYPGLASEAMFPGVEAVLLQHQYPTWGIQRATMSQSQLPGTPVLATTVEATHMHVPPTTSSSRTGPGLPHFSPLNPPPSLPGELVGRRPEHAPSKDGQASQPTPSESSRPDGSQLAQPNTLFAGNVAASVFGPVTPQQAVHECLPAASPVSPGTFEALHRIAFPTAQQMPIHQIYYPGQWSEATFPGVEAVMQRHQYPTWGMQQATMSQPEVPRTPVPATAVEATHLHVPPTAGSSTLSPPPSLPGDLVGRRPEHVASPVSPSTFEALHRIAFPGSPDPRSTRYHGFSPRRLPPSFNSLQGSPHHDHSTRLLSSALEHRTTAANFPFESRVWGTALQSQRRVLEPRGAQQTYASLVQQRRQTDMEGQQPLLSSQRHHFEFQQEEGLQSGIANLQQQVEVVPTRLRYSPIAIRDSPESKEEQSIVASSAADMDIEAASGNAMQAGLSGTMASPAWPSLFESSSAGGNQFRASSRSSTIPLPRASLPPRMHPMTNEPSMDDEQTSKHDWYALHVQVT